MRRTSLRLAATALAILLGCLALSSASATATPLGKHHVKLSAAPLKNKVHRGEHVRVHGHLASAAGTGRAPMAAADYYADVLYLQEETAAGVWIDLASTDCYPDSDFDINLSLNVSVNLILRVYAPETVLYAAATSGLFALVVL